MSGGFVSRKSRLTRSAKKLRWKAHSWMGLRTARIQFSEADWIHLCSSFFALPSGPCFCFACFCFWWELIVTLRVTRSSAISKQERKVHWLALFRHPWPRTHNGAMMECFKSNKPFYPFKLLPVCASLSLCVCASVFRDESGCTKAGRLLVMCVRLRAACIRGKIAEPMSLCCTLGCSDKLFDKLITLQYELGNCLIDRQ